MEIEEKIEFIRIAMAESWANIDEAIEGILEKCGLPGGFFESLQNEDDWSYIIKLHAVIEATTNQSLTKILGDDRLESFVANLEMSDKRRGKLAILSLLDLVFNEVRSFINALSELRNELVHNIQNVRFKFNAPYPDKLKKKIDQLAKACEQDGICSNREFIEANKIFFKTDPRLSIHLQARWTIALLATVFAEAEVKKEFRALVQRACEYRVNRIRQGEGL